MKRVFLSLVALAALCSFASAANPYLTPTYHYRPPTAYINGGFVGPGFYMPYSYTVTPTYGGAIYQGNGGNLWWGGYSPYSYGGFVPSYGYGYGYPAYGWGGGY